MDRLGSYLFKFVKIRKTSQLLHTRKCATIFGNNIDLNSYLFIFHPVELKFDAGVNSRAFITDLDLTFKLDDQLLK